MISKIFKAMTDAVGVLSTTEKTYIACCMGLVIVDVVLGLSPTMFRFGFIVLLACMIPVLILAKKTEKNVSAILSGVLMVFIYTLGQGYLTQ